MNLRHSAAVAYFVFAGLASVGCARRQVVAAPHVEAPPPPAPAKAAEAPAPEAPKEDALAAVLRDTVLYFSLDESNLSSESQARLRTLADALRQRPGATVRIAGHCDERGTVEYNLALGQRRADVARRYLLQLGVSPEAVDTVSFGAERPAAEGHHEGAWAQNRRAETEAVQR